MGPSVFVQSSALCLLLIACLFISYGSSDQYLRGDNCNTTKRSCNRANIARNIAKKSRYYSEGTCTSQSRCSGDETDYATLAKHSCYCDEACYKIFSDCCPDYVKHCGRQKLFEHESSMWKCIEFYNEEIRNIKEDTGYWMISRCPSDWSIDELRSR